MNFRPHFFRLFVFIVLVVPIFGQRILEREEYGYIGAVKSVRIKIVSYEREEGNSKAEKRKLESVETYDVPGNLVENVDYDNEGVLDWHYKGIFEGGRVIGWQSISSPDDEWSKFLYKFDAAGNIVEQNSYGDDGKLGTQSAYLYDQQNRKIQQISQIFYTEGPTDLQVTTYSYDEKGRLLEQKTFVNGKQGLTPVEAAGFHQMVYINEGGKLWTSLRKYSKGGQLVGTISRKRDDRGNETEDLRYDGVGNIESKVRYEYKYDKNGNWIVKKTLRWTTANGQDSYQPDEIEYRKIEYFKK